MVPEKRCDTVTQTFSISCIYPHSLPHNNHQRGACRQSTFSLEPMHSKLFVRFDALHPSQQCFSHVGTRVEPVLCSR